MNKKMFKRNEYIQFYLHLVLLIFGGVLLVLIAQDTSEFVKNNSMWITTMVVLLIVVSILTIYQTYRVLIYRKYFLKDPEVTIWKTITTLMCYPIDIVFYVIVLVALM